MVNNEVIAIDVGAKGSLCHLNTDNKILKFLRFDKTGLRTYFNYIYSCPNVPIIVERVNAMPKQGVTSMFSFGERLGEIRAILMILEADYEELRPTDWQKLFCKVTSLQLDKTRSTKEQIGQQVSNIFRLDWLYKKTGKVNTDFTDSIAMAYAYLRKNNDSKKRTNKH